MNDAIVMQFRDGEPLPIEHIAEYDSAAEWCAGRGLKGRIGDPLPANMDANGALRWIQADPEAFEERVRQCAYAAANAQRASDFILNKTFEETE